MVKKSIASLEAALSAALNQIDGQARTITELQTRNQTNIDNLLAEQTRLADVIRKLEVENRDHRKTADAAQEGRTHLLQDIARLSGMLDMLREIGAVPKKEEATNEFVAPIVPTWAYPSRPDRYR